MFQFRRFPTYAYLIQRRLTEYCSAGFPHSVIHGSTRMCRSPWLIAACHDLLRLLMPRHSPCALSSLTSSEQAPYPSPPAKAEGSLIPLLFLSRPGPRRRARSRFRRARTDACSVSWFSTVSRTMQAFNESSSGSLFYPFEFHKLLLVSSVACFTFLECFSVVQFSRCKDLTPLRSDFSTQKIEY